MDNTPSQSEEKKEQGMETVSSVESKAPPQDLPIYDKKHPLRLAKTLRDMLRVLSDGMPHGKEELHACLWDQEGAINNICTHITKLRRILNKRGQTIVCEYFHRKAHYRWVRLLRSPADD